jgi:hypothetical protein
MPPQAYQSDSGKICFSVEPKMFTNIPVDVGNNYTEAIILIPFIQG